jgi:hypothetical protein
MVGLIPPVAELTSQGRMFLAGKTAGVEQIRLDGGAWVSTAETPRY